MAKKAAVAKVGEIEKLSFVRFGMTNLKNVGVGGMVRRMEFTRKKDSWSLVDIEDKKGLYGGRNQVKKSHLNKITSGILKDTPNHIIRQGYCRVEDEIEFGKRVKEEAIREWEKMKAEFDGVNEKWEIYKAAM